MKVVKSQSYVEELYIQTFILAWHSQDYHWSHRFPLIRMWPPRDLRLDARWVISHILGHNVSIPGATYGLKRWGGLPNDDALMDCLGDGVAAEAQLSDSNEEVLWKGARRERSFQRIVIDCIYRLENSSIAFDMWRGNWKGGHPPKYEKREHSLFGEGDPYPDVASLRNAVNAWLVEVGSEARVTTRRPSD